MTDGTLTRAKVWRETSFSSPVLPFDRKKIEPLHEKKTTTIWVPTRTDTNRGVQAQKMVRGWKFWIWKVEELYYPCSENKGAAPLRSY